MGTVKITDNYNLGDPDTALSSLGSKNLMNLLFPVGCIIYSTTLSTAADVIAHYGGSSWVQHSGYFLRGASSSTSNSAAADGGSDNAIVVSHNHTFTGESVTSSSEGAHTHTATTASAGGHTHTATTSSAGAHTHTATTSSAGAHTHTANSAGAHTHSYQSAPWSSDIAQPWMSNGDNRYTIGWTSRNTSSSGAHTHGTTSAGAHTHTLTTSSNGAHTHTLTTSNSGAHTHTLTTSSNGAHTHTITATGSISTEGSSGTNANLPRYKNVYIWERVA